VYPHTLRQNGPPLEKLENTMKTREKTNDAHSELNDEALEYVAGGMWDDGGCTPFPDILKLLAKVWKPEPIHSR
jgi:hypothetical protein